MTKNCNLCGLCKDVCPNALPFSKSSEAEGIQEKSGESGIAGGLAWSRKPIDFPVRDMLFSNSDEFSLCRHSPDREESAYLFFPGCQMAASMPEYIAPAYRYLQQKLDSVGIFLGCCGAPADWSGQSQLFEQTMAELLAKWEQMGKPTMIVGCTTCYQQFKAAELRMQVLLLWEIFAEYGLPQLSRQPHPVAVHDSCTIRYEKKVQDAVRQILQQAGYQIEELKNSRENTKCCGYSGLVFCEDKDLATKAVLDRVEESSLDYLVYCTVCRNYFISVGKPTYHILDVIFGQDSPEIASKPAPTLRQQEENRRKLKRTLLQEFYQDGGKNSRGEGPLLFIDPQLHRLLEERLIDEDKIQEVILSAEEQNRKLLNPKNNHYIASLQPGIITYWVEYAPKDGGYEVYNAYSHRIKIGEGD